ncbi:hypothetical protein FLFR108385_13355 [Flavobacterium frigoris]
MLSLSPLICIPGSLDSKSIGFGTASKREEAISTFIFPLVLVKIFFSLFNTISFNSVILILDNTNFRFKF